VPGGFEARDLWKHSIAVATASRLVATRAKGAEPSEAFLAGLMHDIGIIVELQACREPFTLAIEALAAMPELTFREAEVRHIGADHEAFGAALCAAWRFPEALKRVSEYHHRPMALPEPVRRLTAIVHVADHLAAQAGIGYARTVEGSRIDPAILDTLGLSTADVDAISDVLTEQVAEVFPLLTGES